MGRSSKQTNSLTDQPSLFDEGALPASSIPPTSNFKSIRYPLWSERKAQLIQEYIRLFTLITKHGTYIDGFSAPQQRENYEEQAALDMCSANLVLNAEPKWIREFWLCDIDPVGIEALTRLREQHQTPKRRIEVLSGDFNVCVDQILNAGTIREKTATFALLDQRTFECHWETVKKLAAHKRNMKIELFYFLASGWLDRSIAAVKLPETKAQLNAWWGNDGWPALQGVQSVVRAKALAARFRDELGYGQAYAYAIHDRSEGGRAMYHMIHATDHPEATPLMVRAYRKVSGRNPSDEPVQSEFLWGELQAGAYEE